MRHQKILAGFIRIHVLHHAAKEPIYGNWMIEELQEHGYKISPGTIYPLLHGMEEEGYLISREVQAEGRTRRLYSATDMGREALQEARERLRELFREVLEDHEPRGKS
jgi:DNA-binding PadR family transcriptional regulator